MYQDSECLAARGSNHIPSGSIHIVIPWTHEAGNQTHDSHQDALRYHPPGTPSTPLSPPCPLPAATLSAHLFEQHCSGLCHSLESFPPMLCSCISLHAKPITTDSFPERIYIYPQSGMEGIAEQSWYNWLEWAVSADAPFWWSYIRT